MADVEQIKERIVQYVMHTPGNSNPSVIRTMLDLLASSSGSENVIEEIQIAGVTITPDENKAVNITNIDGVNIGGSTVVVGQDEHGDDIVKTINEILVDIPSKELVSDEKDGLAPKLHGNEVNLFEDGDYVLAMRHGAPV
jgi:hypothetical protein